MVAIEEKMKLKLLQLQISFRFNSRPEKKNYWREKWKNLCNTNEKRWKNNDNSIIFSYKFRHKKIMRVQILNLKKFNEKTKI